MNRRQKRHSGSFATVNDDGATRGFHQYQDYYDAGGEWVPGMTEIRTENLEEVNGLGDGRYQVVADGTVWRRR